MANFYIYLNPNNKNISSITQSSVGTISGTNFNVGTVSKLNDIEITRYFSNTTSKTGSNLRSYRYRVTFGTAIEDISKFKIFASSTNELNGSNNEFQDVTSELTLTWYSSNKVLDISGISNLDYATIWGTTYGFIFVFWDNWESATTYTITENLTNITSDNTQTSIEENTEFTFNYTANADCYIDSLVSNIGTVTIADDRKTATISGTATENITITGVASIPHFTITETLENVTSDNTETEIAENAEFTFNYTANDGYIISALTSNIGTVTIAENKRTATITGIATENIIISGTGKILYYVTVSDSATFENATCNYSLGVSEYLQPVVITPNNGYEFVGVYTWQDTDSFLTHSWNVAENGTLTLNVTENITLNDNYNATAKVEKISNFVYCYNPTVDELNALAKVRFYETSGETVEIVDYGEFITALYILPFDLTTLQGDKTNIILGTYDSNVQATLLKSYKLEIDLGTVTIPLKYNNVYDFLNTECKIIVPFFNEFFLENDYVINQTLTFKFIVNLYSGNVTLNVYSTFNDNIVYSATANVNVNIPFIQKQNNTIVGSLNNIFTNESDTVSIEVTRNIPYFDNENIFGKETVDYEMLGNCIGYIEVSDCKLETTATNDEKDDIINLLKQGVFINE